LKNIWYIEKLFVTLQNNSNDTQKIVIDIWKKELTEDQIKFKEYLYQFIKESGHGPRGFFVELKTGEYLLVDEYNEWITKTKLEYEKSKNSQ